MYDQYLMNFFNTIMGNGWSKAHGNHEQLHEATALWQIEFLYNIGFSHLKQDEIENIRDLLNVWEPIVKYISPLNVDLDGDTT